MIPTKPRTFHSLVVTFPRDSRTYDAMEKSYISYSIKCIYNGGGSGARKKKKDTKTENRVAEAIVESQAEGGHAEGVGES